MQIGIVGLPLSGKTTVFNALTGRAVSTSGHTGSGEEINIASVKVPDPRLDFLFDHFEPKKKVQVELKLIDFAAVKKGGGGFSDRHIADLRNCNALLLALRAFDNPAAPHPDGRIDAAADFENLSLEFALADLQVVEKKLSKMDESIKKSQGEERGRLQKEKPVLEKINAALEAGKSAATVPLTAEEQKIISGYGLLTLKPMMVVLNVGEGDMGKGAGDALKSILPSDVEFLEMSGAFEMEISQLDASEQKEFLADAGISEPASARVIRAAYNLLGLMVFYTAGGKDEAAAWQIRVGDTAHTAAGKIHSDIARGFIRAEVTAFEDFKQFGGFSAARDAGKFRLEGKEYVVQDGDIITFRFNV